MIIHVHVNREVDLAHVLTQVVLPAVVLAWLRTGSNSAARTAMMAMTTSSSIKVNPRFIRIFLPVAAKLNHALPNRKVEIIHRIKTKVQLLAAYFSPGL
jgi:hypothetical protein